VESSHKVVHTERNTFSRNNSAPREVKTVSNSARRGEPIKTNTIKTGASSTSFDRFVVVDGKSTNCHSKNYSLKGTYLMKRAEQTQIEEVPSDEEHQEQPSSCYQA
jgi:hypothetical protein